MRKKFTNVRIIKNKKLTSRKIKHETLTSYIKHLEVSGLSNVLARMKCTCNITGKCFEMPNVSYT